MLRCMCDGGITQNCCNFAKSNKKIIQKQMSGNVVNIPVISSRDGCKCMLHHVAVDKPIL